MAKDINNIIYKVQVDASSGKISIDGVTKSFEQADKAFLKLRNDIAKGLPKATKEVNNLRTASGGATTSVLELGRVVSDAPYGIRGMANNVSQLASNMLFTSQQIDQTTGKVIGFGGVLKDMGKVFMGPLGLLFLIQGAIAALDYFKGAATKAKKELESFRVAAGGAAADLKSLLIVMKEDMLSKEDLAVVVGKVNEKYKDLNLSIDEEGKLTKESIKQIDNKILSLEKLAKANAMMSAIEEKQKEIITAQLKLQEDTSERLKSLGAKDLKDFEENKDELIKVQDGYYKGQIDAEKLATKARIDSAVKSFNTEKTRVESQIKELLKLTTDEGFFDDFFNGKSGNKGKKAKRAKVEYFDFKSLEEGRGKIIAEIMKTDEKIALLSAKDKKSRLIIQRDFHLRRLMAVDGANSELINTYKDYYAKLIGIEEEAEITRNSKADLSFGTGGLTLNEVREKQAQILEVKLQTMMEASQAISSFINSEFQREITMEQNKTNAINNELKERLNNENLSASERKRIQLKISKNDEAMRVKKEKLEKKAFKIQKAANIANALVSTYSGASAAYFNSLANPINKLLPDGGLVRAKINAGIAAAVGLTNVAMIARQKFQSSSAGAPSAGALGGSGGSGGGNDRSFNFNLAGASRENQLANTLQGRFNQPLQAYVVGRDITNQQQLDEEITSSASFG